MAGIKKARRDLSAGLSAICVDDGWRAIQHRGSSSALTRLGAGMTDTIQRSRDQAPRSTVLVVGFCDVHDKRRGLDDCVLFDNRDFFMAATVPPPADLMQYAQWLGYYPSGKRGAVVGRCDPIYYCRALG